MLEWEYALPRAELKPSVSDRDHPRLILVKTNLMWRGTPLVMTPAVFERLTVSPLIEPLSSRE
jgi:hypothetical protein